MRGVRQTWNERCWLCQEPRENSGVSGYVCREKYPGVLVPYKCDVSKDDELEKMFEWTREPPRRSLTFADKRRRDESHAGRERVALT
ncbi:Dehydrogenase/reductase SDR family member 11 [Orchesella cincta]|uniref:Dehydrogenase/reductase SDR family member 11 n=1 Tax=Orchesella cincta TaxID=48709 RepID=A0A1D2M697_ORCCI|nr:Dehydrogenase/reductase SDR family member 11 [Orchesella cincta]